MEDRNVKWRVGVVVVATFVVAALLIAASTSFDLPFGVGQYAVTIEVDSAPGVGRNTPIRRDGVLIGRVERTESIDGGRLIYAKINQGEPLRMSDRCLIRPSSLFGDAVIDFVQQKNPGQIVQAGDKLFGKAQEDPLQSLTELQVEIGPAVESLGQAGSAVAELATRINRIIGQEADGQKLNLLLDKGIVAMDDFSATMEQMSTAAEAINAVVGEPETQQNLNKALANLPLLVENLSNLATQAETTIRNLNTAIDSAERNLENIEGLTKPIGERGPELAESAIAALENLDIALADISRFAKSLGESEGTVGKLVNDPELYNNLNTTICNANIVIARVNELAKQLRPILGDVRVFTDKVSREPGRLVKGALNGGSEVK